jgi:hypothetical protein
MVSLMARGTRWIDGREYLLGGRVSTKEQAISERADLLRDWSRVRIIKRNDWDYMLYVHGWRQDAERLKGKVC